jgi:hypothetical protein
MFPRRFFALVFFPLRYFCKAGADASGVKWHIVTLGASSNREKSLTASSGRVVTLTARNGQ